MFVDITSTSTAFELLDSHLTNISILLVFLCVITIFDLLRRLIIPK